MPPPNPNLNLFQTALKSTLLLATLYTYILLAASVQIPATNTSLFLYLSLEQAFFFYFRCIPASSLTIFSICVSGLRLNLLAHSPESPSLIWDFGVVAAVAGTNAGLIVSARNVSRNRGYYPPLDTLGLVIMQVLCAVIRITHPSSADRSDSTPLITITVFLVRLVLSVTFGQGVKVLVNRELEVKLKIGETEGDGEERAGEWYGGNLSLGLLVGALVFGVVLGLAGWEVRLWGV